MRFPNQDEYPNNCTVYVQVEWDDGSFTRGSGAMVGRNDILTAAHVVYDPAHTAVDIDIYPAYDGAAGPWGSFTSGTWQTNYYTVGNADHTISREDSTWDMAVIGLPIRARHRSDGRLRPRGLRERRLRHLRRLSQLWKQRRPDPQRQQRGVRGGVVDLIRGQDRRRMGHADAMDVGQRYPDSLENGRRW
jgi:hypothetical protein